MSAVDETLSGIRESKDYEEKAQLTALLTAFLKHDKKVLFSNANAVLTFMFDEAKKLMIAFGDLETYLEKDKALAYGNALLGIALLYAQKGYSFDKAELEEIQNIAQFESAHNVFENEFDTAFEKEKVEKSDAEKLLSLLASVDEEYYKGKLYKMLLSRKDVSKKLTPDAKELFTQYLVKEARRYLDTQALTEIEAGNFELLVDAADAFYDPLIEELLKECMKLKNNDVRFFALKTLVGHGYRAETDVIKELAHDLVYAELTFHILKGHGQEDLFPQELNNKEYLAKSDLVHWLCYPTELNGVPDEIEFLGTAKKKKELFYIFKFKSESDTLAEENKNEWLIGWSNENGGTFSPFAPLKDFERGKTKKTLKRIASKLL